MVRLELEIHHDSILPAIRRVVVESGQTLIIGRTQSSDVCMEHDSLMSSRHFQIKCEGGEFILTESPKHERDPPQRTASHRSTDQARG